MSSSVKVLGGSVDKRTKWVYSNRYLVGSSFGQDDKRYLVKAMKELSVADEAAGVRVMGAVGWGAVGTLIAGPIGLLVGGLLGGRGKTVTFVGKFSDEKTMLGQVDQKVWVKMLAERV